MEPCVITSNGKSFSTIAFTISHLNKIIFKNSNNKARRVLFFIIKKEKDQIKEIKKISSLI